MGWRERVRELLLAGGALVVGGCSNGGSGVSVPCGNANPDPCICGRPEVDSLAKMQCDQKQACEADGGIWDGYLPPDAAPGTVVTQRCLTLKAGSDALVPVGGDD